MSPEIRDKELIGAVIDGFLFRTEFYKETTEPNLVEFLKDEHTLEIVAPSLSRFIPRLVTEGFAKAAALMLDTSPELIEISVGPNKQSILEIAALSGHIDILELIADRWIKSGRSLERENNLGQTVYNVAEEQGLNTILVTLKRLGADSTPMKLSKICT